MIFIHREGLFIATSSEYMNTIEDFFDKYALRILKALQEKPLRYVDIKDACSNESTRTIKIRMLEEHKLIEATPDKVNGRNYSHYQLTGKGKRILELVQQL